MAESQSIEDRLRGHARAFDGLLALIPAKQYYGEDTSDQWQRKKQTKEEARAAKFAKLDPENNKSALDIIKENERKRKREEGQQDEAGSEGGELEKPRQGMKAPKAGKKQKKDMISNEANQDKISSTLQQEKADKKRGSKEEKKAKKEAKQARKSEKPVKKSGRTPEKDVEEGEGDSETDAVEDGDAELSFLEGADLGSDKEDLGLQSRRKPDKDPGKTEPQATETASLASVSSGTGSPAFDFSAQPSGTSSISSIGTTGSLIPGEATGENKPTEKKRVSSFLSNSSSAPRLTMEEMQERLRQRIAEKRAQRNADVEGKPAKTRAELIDSRRKKQEQRKATKKALRQQAKEEEKRQREEAIARGSPLMSPAIHSPPNGEDSNSFSFGRVAFDDSHTMTADLSGMMDLSRRKGPSDAKTALLKAGAKDARLAGLDGEKRAEALEKDMWLNARKRAHGEKVRDDSSLLKKALKRKQKQKEKSSTDWKKRLDGIKASKEAKQRKREENLTRRKEDKGKKGTKGTKTKKPKKRPGFEGSFRAGGRK